jgi:catechol 2,3-dioxygenase-like lactoylglutathione lyase family enzyme
MGGAVRLVHPARRAGGLNAQSARPLWTGLHHLAFSAESREQVDAFHRDVLLPVRATVLDPPQIWPQYSEGYYALFFLGPDGIKLELAHTPAQSWT